MRKTNIKLTLFVGIVEDHLVFCLCFLRMERSLEKRKKCLCQFNSKKSPMGAIIENE